MVVGFNKHGSGGKPNYGQYGGRPPRPKNVHFNIPERQSSYVMPENEIIPELESGVRTMTQANDRFGSARVPDQKAFNYNID